MTIQRPPHHPVLDALLAADLSEDDLYILGLAFFAVVGKMQIIPSVVPEWGGGRMERWAATQLRRSLLYTATGVDPDASKA